MSRKNGLKKYSIYEHDCWGDFTKEFRDNN